MKHVFKTLDKKLEKLSKKNKELKLSNDNWAREHYSSLKIVKGLEEEKKVLMKEVERLTEDFEREKETSEALFKLQQQNVKRIGKLEEKLNKTK